MAKLASIATDFVRKIFARERQNSELAISTKELAKAQTRNSFGHGTGFDLTGNGGIGDVLGNDRRLLHRYADYEEMDEYGDISCLAGDSRIFTFEKGMVSVKDLVDWLGPFEIMAYDRSRGEFVSALCHKCEKTGDAGHGKSMVEVVINNGTSIKCTGDHLFMTDDGEWIHARSLKTNSCLMSLEKVPGKSGDLVSVGHRVKDVLPLKITEDVYDLTVPNYHNFVCNGVVVHNSCLDIYADDATQTDSEADHTLWVESKDQAVRDDLTDVFQKRIKTDENAWEMMRTLCKYGNDFEEIVIGENGVVALNYLPPATCRRVDSDRGDFLGVVQSFSSDLEINAKQFEAMKTKTGAMVNPDGNMAAFEDWRVAHMRLRSKNRESPYGWGCIEAARWIWRRLMLLEDAVLVYKLCLRGDTKVWTPDGRKAIRDLEDGDEVYSYGEDSNLKKTRVVSKKHNGKDVLYRVRSAHRELYANATHPILVETIIHNGKGSLRGHRLDYVEVQDLDPNIHRLVTPSKGDDLCELVSLAMPEVGQKARLSSRALEAGVKMEAGIKHLQDTCGMQSNLIKKFFAGEYEVVAHTAEKVLLANGTPLHYLDVRDDWGGVKKLSLPDAITPDFAQWFGFMIGDGFASEFASECAFKQRDKTYFLRKVGFAAGDKEDINQKYKVLFESFFGEVKFERDKRSKHECVGKYVVSSKALYEFMILNGYIPGAHNKRIPEWVFRSPVSVREAFLAGLADADGHITEGSVSPIRNRVKYSRVVLELCNRALVDDVRELAMQTGYVVGRVRSRIRKGGREILESGFLLSDLVSYSVAWSYERQPITEPLWEVEEVETDDIWDIGVEANEHNFVANGIVVHNSRSPSRYAFYVDVGNLPRQEAERVIEQVKNKVKKKKFVNPRTGKLDLKFNPLSFDEDFFLAMRDGQEKTRIDVLNGPSYQQVEDVQYFLSKLYAALKVPRAYLGYDENMPSKATLCLSGDTKILLLDGTSPTIEELAKKNESFWVYSIDENKNVVPGLASAPRLTRNGAPTVQVELDNGEVIVCTPDHPIMNRFGNYVGASELMPGDSLMPLHRRMSSGKVDGYEEVYDPGDNRWRYTHNMVNDALFRGEEAEMVCHHKNFDRRDNRPTNLSFVSLDEHRNIQSSNTDEELAWSDVRVVSVKHGEFMDTFDLTVDDYHNFAIGQGVFVHNSQEDVRFARTVLRIQSEFINGMRKIARVHLATRRIDPAAVDFQIKMAVPSAIFELGQMEVRRARADLASQMERHVSSYFLLSNIYGLSDDEIAAITKQKKEEQKSMGGGMGGSFESVDHKGNVLAGSGLSDRELSEGNREHEKAIEEMLHKEIAKANTPLGRQMKETLALVREIASATSGVNW